MIFTRKHFGFTIRKLLLLLVISLYSHLLASTLQNNYTLVVSTVSSLENANTFIKRHLSQIKTPIYVLKSQRGFHMVTLGTYNSREEAFLALGQFPQAIKNENPFLSTLNYDLTSDDARILSRLNESTLPKETQQTKIVKNTIPKQKKLLVKKEPAVQKSTINKTENSYIDSISIAYGQNKSHKNLYRIGIQKNFQERYLESTIGFVSGYYDLAISRLNYDKDIYSFSLSPVFTYNFKTASSITPYIFGGIGATFLSDTSTQNKQFSTAFQFEDRIGLGAKQQNHALELGYYHNSNASLKKPNDGMDMLYLTYLHSF